MVALPPSPPTNKELKAKHFPKCEHHPSILDYVTALRSYVERLRGYDDATVAEALYQAIIDSKHSSSFRHQYGRSVPKGTYPSSEDILDILNSTDYENAHLTPEERFRNIRKKEGESKGAFIMRVEKEFDLLFSDRPYDQDTRFLQIKRQFIECGNFPDHIQVKLGPYSNKKELLYAAESLSRKEIKNPKGKLSWEVNDRNASFYIGNVDINTTMEDVEAIIEKEGVYIVVLEELKRRDNKYKSFKLVVSKEHINAIERHNSLPHVRKWRSPKKSVQKWTPSLANEATA